MTKPRKDNRNEFPPAKHREDTIIWFGEGIPQALRRHTPKLDDSMPAWLRDRAASWRPVAGCSNLFFTESLPASDLGDEIVEWIMAAERRQLMNLTYFNSPGLASWWTVEAIDIGPTSRLYVEWREILYWCLLAYSDDPDQGRGDRNALRALFRNNGMEFDRVLMVGPPDEAGGSEWVSDELLVELLGAAFGRGGWWGEVPHDPVALARTIVAGERKGS